MALSPQDALVTLMVVTAAVDRTLTDQELNRIDGLVARLPVFEGFDRSRLPELARDAVEATQAAEDLEEVLENIFSGFPERLFDTAYAMAVEVAAVDLNLKQSELQFLQMIEDHLELDKLVVAAIERAARARLKRA